MKIGIKIMPREEVLDTQGRAVEKILLQHGHQIQTCKVGKYIMVDVKDTDEKTALEQATKMATFVLHNPLIEKFEIQLLK